MGTIFAGGSIIKNDNIWWVKESAGIIVIDINKRIYWLLTGFEEDLWQFLALNDSFDDIVEICKHNFGSSIETAQKTVIKKIEHWIEQGIFQVRD